MRAFYTSTDGCCELVVDNFPDESAQHEWFENNLNKLFPNLELVKSKMPIEKKIPDTVAYDPKTNAFVAIEYKNKPSDTVRQQAKNYLHRMKDNHEKLILAYTESYNVNRKSNSFKRNNMYAIIVAPEFNDEQIYAANKNNDEYLYELKRFENGFVTLRFIAGKRGPINIAKTTPTPEVPRISDATNAKMEPTSPDIGAHEAKNSFYVPFRDRILSTFPEMREYPTKLYVGFGRAGETRLCTAEVQRSKIVVCYGKKDDFTEDEFVRDVSNIGKFGMGNYRTHVKNRADIERLLPILKQVKTVKRQTSNSTQ